MAFRFRLQSYLNVKTQIEEQKQNEYAQALRRLEEEKEKKRRMEREIDQTVEGLRTIMATTLDPVDAKYRNDRISLLRIRIAEQEVQIAKAEQFAEKKRLELVEAMKQRKMMDTIKDNHFEQYREEEKRDDQKITDAIVSYRYTTRTPA